MRVLGIDPGLRNLGWGVIDVIGARITHVANGICQVTSSAGSGDAGGGANLTLAPAKDQQACLAAVSNKTNNGEVTVLDTNSSEANNTVIVGVGEQKAKWRCLVKNGRVADVMSLTDEGAL